MEFATGKEARGHVMKSLGVLRKLRILSRKITDLILESPLCGRMRRTTEERNAINSDKKRGHKSKQKAVRVGRRRYILKNSQTNN